MKGNVLMAHIVIRSESKPSANRLGVGWLFLLATLIGPQPAFSEADLRLQISKPPTGPVTVHWQTVTSATDYLEYRDSLGSGEWNGIPPCCVSYANTEDGVAATDFRSSSASGFYRVTRFSGPNDTAAYLLRYSAAYADEHRNPLTGMLRDATGLDNVRDTAIAMLIWADQGRAELAIAALRAVLDNQILDEMRPQYGNFLFHPGEDTFDNNWSAYIGTFLLVFHQHHADLLDPELTARIRQAIGAAAGHRSRIRVNPNYTNIAILNSFVLLRAGELLQDTALLTAGTTNWSNFVAYTDGNGIAEYNSPNYMKVDLYGLGFMADCIEDTAIVAQVERIRQLYWWSVANHYHAPTGQLAGPWKRTLTDRMIYELTAIQAFLFRESSGRIALSYDYLYVDDNRLHAGLPALLSPSLPAAWLQHMVQTSAGHQFRERTAFLSPGNHQQITTYLTSNLVLGSVNKDVDAPTRRLLIGHAADPETHRIGVFKATTVRSTPINNVFVLSCQQNESVLTAIVGNQYIASNAPVLQAFLDWYGTAENIPCQEGGGVSFGSQLDITWMGRPVAVRIGDRLVQQSTISVAQSTDPPLVRLALETPLPSSPSSGMYNSRQVVAFVFGAHFAAPGEDPPLLEPVTVTDQGTHYQIDWPSPSGALRLRFESRVDSWHVEDSVDGTPVPASPLSPL